MFMCVSSSGNALFYQIVVIFIAYLLIASVNLLSFIKSMMLY